MKRTAVRELLKVTSQPDMISFAGGLPAAELFPVSRVERAARNVLQTVGAKSLQYSETEGIPALREWIAGTFSRSHFRIAPENVLVTTGAQQALDLIGRTFLDPSSRVAIENPTYLALLSAWRPNEAEFLPVPSDEQGIDVNALDSLAASPGSVTFIYVVPSFQNPRGATLSLARRQSLVALLRRHQIPLLEDDPYGQLRYDGEPLPSLFELDATGGAGTLDGRVIYTGTFSKVLIPGLRVGWVIAPKPVIDKLVQAKQAADLHTSTLCQYIALDLLKQGFLEEFIPVLKRHYSERRDVMLNALERCFPRDTGVKWTRPDGGMFLLLTLPADIDATRLLPEALQKNVAYVPGEEFHLDGQGKNTMRLNFSNARPEQIELGIERLSALFKDRLRKTNCGRPHC
jgi:2-aminoadipate transaminase